MTIWNYVRSVVDASALVYAGYNIGAHTAHWYHYVILVGAFMEVVRRTSKEGI